MHTLHTYRHYVGVLFDRGERWKLIAYMIGSTLLGLLDTASVLIVAPLILAMGDSWRSGTAGRLATALNLDSQQSLVATLLGITVGGFILKDLLSIAFSWWSSSFTAAVRARSQMELTNYYMRKPYHEHAHLGLALIMRKTTITVSQAYGQFAGALLALCTQAISVACISIALILSAPVVTIILIVFIGASSGIYLRTVRPLNDSMSRDAMIASEESYSATYDAFGAIKETQLRHSYRFFLDAISNPTFTAARLQKLGSFLGGLPKQLMEILFMVGLGVAFTIASLTGTSQDLLPSLAMLVAGAFRLLPSIAGAIGSSASIRQGLAGTREFVTDKQAAREQASTQKSSTDGPLISLHRQIEADQIRFRYGPDSPDVLGGISLSIQAGSTAAFVGSSGAGKSTLLDIVMGLQTPTSGRLLVDGTDVQANLSGWQRNIGVVPQEVFLTDRTIAENVAFDCAKEDIDEALVRRALEQADILDFVESQPEGIWSSFGERGRRLSGGQRQRIGIARALYRRPAVLILDEATSALDNETEARIAETISALRGQITTIIVAHRLSTVRDADLIAFLADGKVEATGTFAELQERSEGFRHLVDLASLSETDPR